MAFTRMAFSPTDGLKNVNKFPSTPSSEDEAREQFQRMFDQVKTQVNALMGALENTEAGYSGAENVGVSPIPGVSGTTMRAILANLKAQMDGISAGSLTDNIVETRHIIDGVITLEKMAENSVDTGQLVAGAVTGDKLDAGAITADKLGVMQSFTLDLRSDVGVGEKDSLSYDTATRKLKLNVAGLIPAQLAPVVYGIGAAAPDGLYPPGTIYVQYVE